MASRINKHGVTPGHSRPKDGVAPLAYDPGVHENMQRTHLYECSLLPHRTDARVKPGHDTAVVVGMVSP
jgi:hypothetical protein